MWTAARPDWPGVLVHGGLAGSDNQRASRNAMSSATGHGPARIAVARMLKEPAQRRVQVRIVVLDVNPSAQCRALGKTHCFAGKTS
jgi:hypothetical protein